MEICAFILWSLRYFIDTLFLGFELYPSGNLNVNKTKQRISFSFFERVCGAGGRNIFFLFVLATMTSLYPIVVSFHENFSHPLIYLLYPEGFQKFFHMHFFSMCIKSKMWCTSSFCTQLYKKSMNYNIKEKLNNIFQLNTIKSFRHCTFSSNVCTYLPIW